VGNRFLRSSWSGQIAGLARNRGCGWLLTPQRPPRSGLVERLSGSRFSVDDKSPMHSSSVAGREIFISHNSGRITAYATTAYSEVTSCLKTRNWLTPSGEISTGKSASVPESHDRVGQKQRTLARFFGTNPEGAWITSGLPVTRAQSETVVRFTLGSIPQCGLRGAIARCRFKLIFHGSVAGDLGRKLVDLTNQHQSLEWPARITQVCTHSRRPTGSPVPTAYRCWRIRSVGQRRDASPGR
jgi:hypothetical protein